MKTGLLLVVCLAAMISLASTVSAAVIGSYTVSSGEEYMGAEHTWTTNLWVSTDMAQPQTAIFNGPDLGTLNDDGIDVFSNVGKTFWIATDQDDPDFSIAANLLTGNQPVYLWIAIGTNAGGTGYPVPINYLLDRPNDYSITNLHGYTIERIGLTIDSASHATDYSAVYPHIYSMAVTCTFEGVPTVPEPTSFIALIAGMGLLCTTRCWKQSLNHKMRRHSS